MFDNSLLIESHLSYRRELVTKSIARSRRGRSRKAWLRGIAGRLLLARRRHLDALEQTQALIDHGAAQLQQRRAGELLAEDLRVAQQALNSITGEFSADDLLGKIFSSFCIGK